MPKSSLNELKGVVAAGQYAIDSHELAGEILSKFAVIRRVRRDLPREDDEGTAGDVGRAPQRRRRGAQPESPPRKRSDKPLP
jgi:hypothetical protein